MRIAIDILSAALGGPGQYMIDFLPHLAQRAAKDELQVLAAHPQLIRRLPTASNIILHDVPAGRRASTRLLWQWASMPRWARGHSIDVVFAPQGLTAMRSGPPVVVLHQDALFLSRERFGRPWLRAASQQWFARRTLKHAFASLFVSRAIRDLAEQRGWIEPDTAPIIPCGVDVDRLRQAADQQMLRTLRAEPPFVLNVNSIMPHKNVPALIEAMHLLHDRERSDIRLLIAGEAPPDRSCVRDVRQLIERHGLRDVVRLLGPLNRAALGAYYQSARLYVTASRLEAHPLTPIEAMGLGAPVLCSDLPAFREVCGEAAAYVDSADPSAVAGAIAALWDDESRRRELIDRGRRHAEQFNWSAAAEGVYRALSDAAESRRKGVKL